MPSAQAKNNRLKSIQIYRPIVYGNIAIPLTKELRTSSTPPEHTHRWTISVKGVNNEDITYFIKRVSFKLHESFANATRTFDAPPFEVTETGWGEFAVQIKIFFHSESLEKPITFYHHLALHPYGPNKEVEKEQNRPITSYQYDEIVFNEPSEWMYDVLTTAPNKFPELPATKKGGKVYALDTEGEEDDRLAEAIKQVREMRDEARDKLVEKEGFLAGMKQSATKQQK